jgi:uncharacterized protein (DUF433 family)
MTTQELEAQLKILTAPEKAELVQLLLSRHTSTGRGIQKTPGVIGGDACIGETRIPVWLMVEYRRQGATDAKILEAYPQLSAADLVNAWVYAEAYPEEIEAAIREQDEA